MLCFLLDCSWQWLNITVHAAQELGKGEVIYPKLHVKIAAGPGVGNPDPSVLWMIRDSFVILRQVQIF